MDKLLSWAIFHRSALNVAAVVVLLITSATGCAAQAQEESMGSQQHGYIPTEGFVPSAEVAVKIAEAVLIPIYGAPRIHRQMPLTAHLEGDRWIVEGTLDADSLGGVARVEISKADGRIIRVTHGR